MSCEECEEAQEKRLPWIGATVVDRRSIKPTDKCICGAEFQKHNGDFEDRDKPVFVFIDKTEDVPTLKCANFFPAKYAIGKEICIQRKRCGSALCVCGDEKNEHLHGEDLDGHPSPFKPVLYKITGGMWHKEWAGDKEENIQNLLGQPYSKEAINILQKWQDEAQSESFKTVEDWLSYYQVHQIDIGKTWRVLRERIQ